MPGIGGLRSEAGIHPLPSALSLTSDLRPQTPAPFQTSALSSLSFKPFLTKHQEKSKVGDIDKTMLIGEKDAVVHRHYPHIDRILQGQLKGGTVVNLT